MAGERRSYKTLLARYRQRHEFRVRPSYYACPLRRRLGKPHQARNIARYRWHTYFEEARYKERHLSLQRRTRSTLQLATTLRLCRARLNIQSGNGTCPCIFALHRSYACPSWTRLLWRTSLQQVYVRLSRKIGHKLGRIHRHGTYQSRRPQRTFLHEYLRLQYITGNQRRITPARLGKPEDVRTAVEGLFPRRKPCGLCYERCTPAYMDSYRMA